MASKKKDPKYYFYVRVVEAQDICIWREKAALRPYQQPMIVVKKNGHEFKDKKTSTYHSGVLWWDKIFRIKTRKPGTDWVSIELRERGFHLFLSDWIGEIQLNIADFKDGLVHQNWSKLSNSTWKRHRRNATGFIHLQCQLKNNKNEIPFSDSPVEKVYTFEEYKQKMEKEHGSKFTEKAIITDSTMTCYNYSSTHTKKEIKASKVVQEEEKEGEKPVSPAESLLIDLDFGSSSQTSSSSSASQNDPVQISSPLFTIPSELLKMQEPLEPSPAPPQQLQSAQSTPSPSPSVCPLCNKPLYFMDDTMINTHIDLCLMERTMDQVKMVPSAESSNIKVSIAFHEQKPNILNPNPFCPLLQAQHF